MGLAFLCFSVLGGWLRTNGTDEPVRKRGSCVLSEQSECEKIFGTQRTQLYRSERSECEEQR